MSSSSIEETSDAKSSGQYLKKFALFIWHFHRKLIISLIVLLAMVMLLFRGAVFYLESNPVLIKDFVSNNLQTRIDFNRINVQISPFSTSITMDNFVIKDDSDGQNSLEFTSANIRIDLLRSLFKRQAIIDTLSLNGKSITFRRDKNGDFYIAKRLLNQKSEPESEPGKGVQKAPFYLQFLNQLNLSIHFDELNFIDESGAYPAAFIRDVQFEMNNIRERHQLSFQARLNETPTKIDFRMDFKGEIEDIRHWNGKVYAAIDKLGEKTALHFMNEEVLQIENYQLNNFESSMQAWSTIEQGSLQSIRGAFLVDDARLTRIDSKKSIYINQLKTNFKLQRDSIEQLWAIDLYGLNLEIDSRALSEKHIALQYRMGKGQQNPEIVSYINEIDLDELSHIIPFFLPRDLNKKVYQVLNPRGRLENLVARLSLKAHDMPVDITHYQIQAFIRGYGNNAFQSLPKIRNFSGRVLFNEQVGQVVIDSQDMKLHLKSLFRDSWPVSRLTGEIYWQKEGDYWLFGGDALSVSNPHLKANADLKLWLDPEGKLLMDLTGFYHDADVQYTSYYLPASIMSEGLVKWLDESIISGWGTDGGVVFRGLLNEFPYIDDTGTMDIVFNTKDVVLEFQQDWPRLTDTRALVQFTEQGMLVEAHHSKILSASSNNTQASIEKYLDPVLRINGDLSGTVADGVEFLQTSLLLSEDSTDILDAAGDIAINLDLSLPLNGARPDNRINITLNNVDYYPPTLKREKGLVSQLSGEVLVHNQSLNSKNLTAMIMGEAANITIKTLKPVVNSPDIQIDIDTQTSIEQLSRYEIIPPALAPFSQYFTGKSPLKLHIDFPDEKRPLSVSIDSQLKGIASQLPEPLAKTANQSFPLKVKFSKLKSSSETKKTIENSKLDIDLSDTLSLALLLDPSSNVLKGNIHFGSGGAKLPLKTALKLTGGLKDIDFEQWQNIVDSSKAGQSKQSKKAGDSGAVLIPVELAMSELVLPDFLAESGDKVTDNGSDTDKGKGKGKGKDEPASATLLPAEFPTLNGYIDSLKLGDKHFGKLTIRSSRMDRSIIFDELTLNSDLISFQGNGKWHHWNTTPEVDFEGELSIPSMEKLFQLLGNENVMRAGELKSSGYLRWNGGINDFSKRAIEGKIVLDVKKGAFLDGRPGAAGRLLGLLNMNAVARRISLDFSDVSHKGFDFDSIKGDFRLTQGNAYTENLILEAPSTKLLITGRAGMAAQDFDQRITVIPEVSATLPLAGAAVAGPAGAAVVWVGQKLLGDKLNQVTAYDYTVTGSWDEPVIERDKVSYTTLKKIKNLFKTDKKVSDDDNQFELDENENLLP